MKGTLEPSKQHKHKLRLTPDTLLASQRNWMMLMPTTALMSMLSIKLSKIGKLNSKRLPSYQLLMTANLGFLLLLLAGCAGSPTSQAVKQTLSRIQPPAVLSTDCDPPSVLPAGALSAGAVERGWAHDISSLMDCSAKHRGLRDYYRDALHALQ